MGSVGIVTAIATLILSFADPATRFNRLLILLGVAVVLVALSQSQWFHSLLTPLIKRALSHTATFEIRDYVGLLNLHRDFHIADITVQEGSWLAHERLDDLELRSGEGVKVLGIQREDGTYIGASAGAHELRPGDTVIAYGQRDRLEELATRSAGDDEAHEQAKDAHDRLLERERRLDPEPPPAADD